MTFLLLAFLINMPASAAAPPVYPVGLVPGAAPTGTIGGLVFYDDDHSGTREAQEIGVSGITVELYTDALGRCDRLVATGLTDANGDYAFVALPAGHYCVYVPPPANPFLISFDLTTVANPYEITLAPDADHLAADFGYGGRGSLSGFVFFDWEQDGVKGFGNEGIADVEVCLYQDVNADAALDLADLLLACTITDQAGDFRFTDQVPDRYLIVEGQPDGLQSTTPDIVPVHLVITQGTGQVIDLYFGDILFVELGGRVWVDVNANGAQEPDEIEVLTGVPIHITGTNITQDGVDLYTATDAAGRYHQSGLLPGTYNILAPQVVIGPSAFYVLVSPETQSLALSVSRPSDLAINFGYAAAHAALIQNFRAIGVEIGLRLTWEVVGDVPQSFHLWRADNAGGDDRARVTAEPVLCADGRCVCDDRTASAGQPYWYWLEDASKAHYGPWEVRAPARPALYYFQFLPLVE